MAHSASEVIRAFRGTGDFHLKENLKHIVDLLDVVDDKAIQTSVDFYKSLRENPPSRPDLNDPCQKDMAEQIYKTEAFEYSTAVNVFSQF